MTSPAILLAISLKDDLAKPERLAHYRPTRRSLPLVRAILEGGAWMAIAPYGSGKSLCAGVGALLCTDPDSAKQALSPVMERIRTVDARLHEAVLHHEQHPNKGLAVALTGYVRDVPAALARAARLSPDSRDLPAVWRQLSNPSGGGGGGKTDVGLS